MSSFSAWIHRWIHPAISRERWGRDAIPFPVPQIRVVGCLRYWADSGGRYCPRFLASAPTLCPALGEGAALVAGAVAEAVDNVADGAAAVEIGCRHIQLCDGAVVPGALDPDAHVHVGRGGLNRDRRRSRRGRRALATQYRRWYRPQPAWYRAFPPPRAPRRRRARAPSCLLPRARPPRVTAPASSSRPPGPLRRDPLRRGPRRPPPGARRESRQPRRPSRRAPGWTVAASSAEEAAATEPSSARPGEGKTAAAPPTSAATTTQVATRALSIDVIPFHLCIDFHISIHQF